MIAPVPGRLTLFAIPKAFRGHIEVIQHNAINSWTRLQPRPEIILFGDEAGTAEAAQELGLRHLGEIARNEFGTPRLDYIFEQARRQTTADVLCYVNSDILLLDDFTDALQRVAAQHPRFLMVGRRTDLDVTRPLAFDSDAWQSDLRNLALRNGKLVVARSVDYFAFARDLYPPLPAFALGRFWWDNWLVWKARSLGAAVVDVSPVVLAIHQNHDYNHYPDGRNGMLAGEEARYNHRLGCELHPEDLEIDLAWRYFYTIDDATHKLTPQGIKPRYRHEWLMFKRAGSHPRGLAHLIGRALASPFKT